MKITTTDLDGYESAWIPKAGRSSNASKLHLIAKDIIKELYPVHIILEEVTLPIRRGTKLRADFFIPSHLIIVEVQGKQHFEFNSFHYNNRRDFAKAKARDGLKKEWTYLNDIELVELPYNESRDEWVGRLTTTE
jgi:hypothetical protein